MTATDETVTRYAAQRGLSERAARSELERIATLARATSERGLMRYRNRSDGVDVSLRVADGVITSANVRDYAARRGGAAARGAGRPRMSGDALDTQIAIRVTATEADQIRRAAEDDHRSVASWLRAAAIAALRGAR